MKLKEVKIEKSPLKQELEIVRNFVEQHPEMACKPPYLEQVGGNWYIIIEFRFIPQNVIIAFLQLCLKCHWHFTLMTKYCYNTPYIQIRP